MNKLERWKGFVPEDELKTYAKGGFANRIGFGERPALLNIDTTYMFVDPAYPMCGGPMDAFRDAVAEITGAFRRQNLPIYYSRRDDRSTAVRRGLWNEKLGLSERGAYVDAYAHDPRADEWPEDYAPRPQDCIIYKNKPSCFFGTPLESFLRYERIDTLVVIGVSTSGCVRAAVTDAFSHNFRVILPEEAVADRCASAHRANLFDMDMKNADVETMAFTLAAIQGKGAAE